MLGAAFGDIVGSAYEHSRVKTIDFELFTYRSRFTDDTVCTAAIAEALATDGDFAGALRRFVCRYRKRGYGGMFERWAHDPSAGPYGSWGNGAAMRVAPVAYAARDEVELLRLARASAAVTHDHPEGIAGAEAVALAIWRMRLEAPRDAVRREIAERFAYEMGRTADDIRPEYGFEVAAVRSVPEAIICGLEGESLEHAVRLAVGSVRQGGVISQMA
jgi:ADP-ribosylglycohydrolase